MIYFTSDYCEGCHEKILRRLSETNMEQTPGYGTDEYCLKAAEKIRHACKAPDAAVHFLVGGTQTNMTVIDSALRAHQGVISADSGHIHTHETGAVESTGHKIITISGCSGKITAEQVADCVTAHRNDDSMEHTVQPGMVYISNPTEWGTIYSKAELTALSETCRKFGIYLFMDGARLGYGLACEENDLTLPDIARLCDVFYIGGTKAGALFGEAVVITHPELQKDFRYMIKQHGGMLAKGRLLGLQFETLFTDELYLEISKHAVILAQKLRKCLMDCGYPFYADSPTNQLFPVLPDKVLQKLSEKYAYTFQCRVDDTHCAVRFCTSWATDEKSVDSLCTDLRKQSC